MTTSFVLHYKLEGLGCHLPKGRQDREKNNLGMEWKSVLQF